MVWRSWVVWVFVVHGGLEVGFDCGVVFVVEGVYLFAECVDLVL